MAAAICLPTLFLRSGKSVGFLRKEIKSQDPLEAVKSLGLFGELPVVALDETKETKEAVKAILREGYEVRLEGCKDLDEALALLDSGVAKIILPANTWDIEEIRPTLVKYKDRFVPYIECKAEVSTSDDIKAMTALTKVTRELLIHVDKISGVEDKKSSTYNKLKAFAELAKASKVILNITGDITTPKEVIEVFQLGLRPQVGDAIQAGKLEMADLFVPFMKTDRPDNLYTTIVCDEQGICLGLVYSNVDSVREAIRKQAGIYHSRRRGLWHKGLSSGATQDLKKVSLDCDRDALRFNVRQNGVGFCHLHRYTCWDGDRGVGHLFRTLLNRKVNPVEGSYTNKLLKNRDMLNAKMLEEATEIIHAKDKDHVAAEAADVLYFASVICTRAGVSWKDVENHLNRRSRRVRRRKGAVKQYAFDFLRKANATEESKKDKVASIAKDAKMLETALEKPGGKVEKKN